MARTVPTDEVRMRKHLATRQRLELGVAVVVDTTEVLAPLEGTGPLRGSRARLVDTHGPRATGLLRRVAAGGHVALLCGVQGLAQSVGEFVTAVAFRAKLETCEGVSTRGAGRSAEFNSHGGGGQVGASESASSTIGEAAKGSPGALRRRRRGGGEVIRASAGAGACLEETESPRAPAHLRGLSTTREGALGRRSNSAKSVRKAVCAYGIRPSDQNDATII